MSRWIRCTRAEGGQPILINTDNVVSIGQDAPETITTITCVGGTKLNVEEDPKSLVEHFDLVEAP